MRSVHVVELLPDDELLPESDAAGVVGRLVELECVGQMRAFDRGRFRSRLAGLMYTCRIPRSSTCQWNRTVELVTVVRADRVDAEGEAFDHVVDELDRTGLGVLVVDLECPDARRIVDRCVLEASDLSPAGVRKVEELHIHLHVVSGHLYRVPDHTWCGAPTTVDGQTVGPASHEHVVDPVRQDRDVVIAAEVPGDAVWPKWYVRCR